MWEIARQVKKYTRTVRIIILSRHDNEEYVNELLKLGVNGYVLKDNAGDNLLRAVAEVSKGNIYLSPRITRKIVTDYLSPNVREAAGRPDSQFTALSTREREILKLIAEGRSNAEIASTLGYRTDREGAPVEHYEEAGYPQGGRPGEVCRKKRAR